MSLQTLPQYETYKDSGIEWLGKIPAHWKLKRFKYLAKINKGKVPKIITGDAGVNAPPYLSMDYLRGGEATQFVLDKNIKIIEDGEILLLWDGSNAGEFIKSRRGVISSTVAEINFNLLSKSFATYACYITERLLRSSTVGMGIPHVDGDKLKNSLLLLPSPEEQTAIAHFLDQKTAQIDAAIAIKEKQIALLKERKQILIQQAVTQGLDPTVPMKDSGVEWIGEIPAHWEVYANRVLFSERIEPGREDLPLLSVSIHSGVSSEEISEEENIRGRIKIEDKTKYLLVKPGDIAFNMMRAWQGAIGAVRTEGMVSPAYIVAKPKSYISAEYFEYQYRCPDFIKQMDRFSKGITDFRKRLYWDGFKQLYTIVPPQNEQSQIETYIQAETEKTNESVNLLNQQIEKLREYKTTLINSAVTGKIKVA